LTRPGQKLEDLLLRNDGVALLVSPFIKLDAFTRVIDLVGAESRVCVVTRWLIEEICSGVSDIGIYEVLEKRGNFSLHLKACLHAKYYKRGVECLVGSANLTRAGLGWGSRNNLEILIEPCQDNELRSFEEELFSGAVEVDRALYLEYRALLDQFELDDLSLTGVAGRETEAGALSEWLPTLRNPEYLYLAYDGQTDLIHTSARAEALQELAILSPPPGLTEKSFRMSIGLTLLQLPMLISLDSLFEEPRRFGYVRDFIRSRLPDRDPSEAWQTTMRWLLYFRPDRYHMFTANYSEVFGRRA
jgi:hypothetical protein